MPEATDQHTAVSKTSLRLDSLTGLRWWAAFAVFLFHMRVFAPIPHTADIVPFGNYGVAFFFILSGFVLTWSARASTTPTTFWWRRFARIYPAHLVALLLAIPVFYLPFASPTDWWVKPFSVGVLLLSVFLLQGWSSDPQIVFSGNPASWTLTCEAFFYALHPLLHRAFLRLQARGALFATACVVLFSFAYRIYGTENIGQATDFIPAPVARLSEFVIGVGIARAMVCGWRLRLAPWACYLAGGMLLTWLVLAQRYSLTDPLSTWVVRTSNEWIILLFTLTIAAVATRDISRRPSFLRRPWLVKLGEWSFCFYLLHATVMYAFLARFGFQETSWLNLGWHGVVFAIALIGSWGLHAIVERPVERRMRVWWDSRSPRRARS